MKNTNKFYVKRVKMRQIDGILEFLRSATNSKNDKELAKNLEIAYGTLDIWKTRDSIPAKRLLEFSKKLGVSMEQLTGAVAVGQNNIAVSGHNNNIGNQQKYSQKVDEFLELYRKYGNEDLDFLLEPIMEKLKSIREISKGK